MSAENRDFTQTRPGRFLTVAALILGILANIFAILAFLQARTTSEDLKALPITAEVLNALFGEDNWFVFPDHRDGVGVVRLREHFQVTPPVLYIDFGEARYGRRETVSGGGAATAKLTGPLGKGVFPAWQYKALVRWEKSRNEARTSWFKAPQYEYVNPDMLNGLLGESSWECDKTHDFAIVARRANSFDVEYPFTAVDGPDNRKYGVGHSVPVPAGQSRMWLAGRLAHDDCPHD